MRPRRVVLLSDGTGNSAAQVWRTNVWRMFSALDLTNDEQVACYDDGVGTSSFKPLALLGGAFGVGLRRNVISLYKFACRNCRTGDDEIFAFGFSRGAFTIRVTIGLILDQGLVAAEGRTETELDEEARQAYRAYHKSHFHTNWWLIYERIRQWLGKPRAVLASEPPKGRRIPVIRFLGLWDTVAAYGLPIDEMTQGVSQWLWPLEIPSHTLHKDVERACHALALDDERTTFHPVLWDETGQAKTQFTKDEKISQVWFTGVHANVGGGYPDDSLAQIPLYWIMQEATVCGLKFKPANPAAVAETKEAQDKDGRLYDSRSGFGGYYRYGPRRVSRLCNQVFSNTTGDAVHIAAPKIHDSVFKRIKNNAHVYAPIGIPHDYELVVTVPKANGVDAGFRIDALPNAVNANLDVYETIGDAQARVQAERSTVWPRVYWREFLYVLTLLATAVLVVFPFVADGNDLTDRENTVNWLSYLIRTLAGFLPGWVSSWLKSYAAYPITFVVLAAIVVVLMFISSRAAASITDNMARLWTDALTHAKPAPAVAPTNTTSGIETLFLGLRSGWKDYLAPALSALVIVYAGISFADRWLFTAIDQAGLVCVPTPTESSKALPDIPPEGMLFSFDIKTPCFPTGHRVGRLDRYLVWTTPDLNELNGKYSGYKTALQCPLPADKTLVNRTVKTNARGYATFFNTRDPELKSWWTELDVWQTTWNAPLLPIKRHYGEPWFRPVARYGSIGAELDFLQPDPDAKVTKISEVVTPRVPDELFFYYNDAVIGLPWHWAQVFYRDNIGCATVFVKPR
jgi:type VI secretion system (T6SS) phospholipase Tle1-like effector